MACVVSTDRAGAETSWDPRRPYRLSGSVSLRPEPFGALVYDFTTRRLSFLKTVALVRVVEQLAAHPDVYGALTAAGVPTAEHERYVDALAGLLAAGTITPREGHLLADGPRVGTQMNDDARERS